MRWMMLLLILPACGGMKKVPDQALLNVPAEQVRTLERYDTALDRALDHQARAQQTVADANQAVAAAEADVKQSRKAWERDRNRKIKAVRDSDPEQAEMAQAAVASSHASYQANMTRLAAERISQEQAEQTLREAKAAVALRRAELIQARAVAANAGGADLNLETYNDQVAEAQQAYDAAVAAMNAQASNREGSR